MPRTRRRSAGFTLVEVLVAVAILVVLVALLLHAVAAAWKTARAAACQANLREWGAAYQMYVNNNRGRTIPEQTNDETTLLWWEALAPYHGNVQAGLLCPEASEPSDRSSARPSATGTASYAWRRQTFAAPRPNRVVRGDWVGSFGFNVWAYAHARAGGTQPNYVRSLAADAARVPLIGDCCSPYTVCTGGDLVPHNLHGAEEDNVSRAALAGYCIDRHRMAVNVVFLDGHAERVPLAGLWRLKWSETFRPRDVVVPRP